MISSSNSAVKFAFSCLILGCGPSDKRAPGGVTPRPKKSENTSAVLFYIRNLFSSYFSFSGLLGLATTIFLVPLSVVIVLRLFLIGDIRFAPVPEPLRFAPFAEPLSTYDSAFFWDGADYKFGISAL